MCASTFDKCWNKNHCSSQSVHNILFRRRFARTIIPIPSSPPLGSSIKTFGFPMLDRDTRIKWNIKLFHWTTFTSTSTSTHNLLCNQSSTSYWISLDWQHIHISVYRKPAGVWCLHDTVYTMDINREETETIRSLDVRWWKLNVPLRFASIQSPRHTMLSISIPSTSIDNHCDHAVSMLLSTFVVYLFVRSLFLLFRLSFMLLWLIFTPPLLFIANIKRMMVPTDKIKSFGTDK